MHWLQFSPQKIHASFQSVFDRKELYFFYIGCYKEKRYQTYKKMKFTHKEQSSDQGQLHLTQQQEDEEQSQSQKSPLNEEELDSALRSMGKLKAVFLRGKISAVKRKYKKINQLFSTMSVFFNRKSEIKRMMKKKTKEERQRMKQKQFQTAVNGTKKEKLKKTLEEIAEIQDSLKQEEQYEPIIQEQSCPNQQLVCHTCHSSYSQIHHFYGSLCSPCAQKNLEKRTQTANLRGLNALVTGGRIKIGYQISLKLLRDGATVFVTSRFPKDCLLRYKVQPDYNNWKSQLHIIQCDFLSEVQVSSLISYIKENVTKLDILINNAAQTIVRPKEFYAREMEHQKLALEFPNEEKQLQLQCVNTTSIEVTYPSVFSNQISIKPEEIDHTNLDEFGQPLDKRKTNNWVQRIEAVSLLDCYTTQVINSIVPFHLISQLRDKMTGTTPSWVINVSSMEGVFYRKGKQQNHPHTNMAKAALNMITRTCASEFKFKQIYMNSVDTGWVTNENPHNIVEHMAEKHKFKCPLDCIDGAMRVLDPIYQGVNHKLFPYGEFIKNYQSSLW